MSCTHPSVRIAVAIGLCVAGGGARHAPAETLCGEWTQVEAPPGFQAFTDVTASSPTDAWALSGGSQAIRWDGSAWSEFALPDLSGMGTAFDLRATASLAPAYFLAAGILQTGVWTTEQLLLIWDGSGWDRIESVELAPNIGGAPRYGSPSAIAAVSPDDLWIIGLATGSGDGVSGSPILTVHWDGSELTEVFTPGVGNRQNNMHDAVAIASDDMWAVGSYNNTGVGDYTFHGMTYHYDGNSWNQVPNPTQSIDSAHLRAVAAVSSDDVWAAGSSPDGPLFMHWDGSVWTIVPGPPGVTGSVQALAAIATDDVWAVDSPWQVPTIGKYYHWDGTAWSVVAPEIAGATQVVRHGGLAAVGACDVWAVGNIDLGAGVTGFIERLQAGGGATDAPVVARLLPLRVTPNPVRDAARIHFARPGDVATDAGLYDVRGRRIRSLLGDPFGAGELLWDGRDDAGARVPGGVYFLRLRSTAGESFMTKLTVVR